MHWYALMVRYKITFNIDEVLGTGLKAIKERDGVSEAEQIRRGIKLYLESKGYKMPRPRAARKGGARRR